MARATADPDFGKAECAVIIRSDLREKGLATKFLEVLLRAITAQGVQAAVLVYPADLAELRTISTELGFETGTSQDETTKVRAVKVLPKSTKTKSEVASS